MPHFDQRAGRTGSVSRQTRGTFALLAMGLGGAWLASAQASSLAQHPVVVAVKKGDCNSAVDLVKHGLDSDDKVTEFLAARMLDEGVCVKRDEVAAAHLFERVGALGDREASLEYAAKVGLGEGSEQSYEHAGELCRKAGVDAESHLSAYSLGYACTVSAIASKTLRDTLPPGAFRPDSGSARVQFTPKGGAMHVLSMPTVARESTTRLGSHVARPVVDGEQVIADAWTKARRAVPAPDAARLEDRAVELPLDVEVTVEAGGDSAVASDGGVRPLQPWDLRMNPLPAIRVTQ